MIIGEWKNVQLDKQWGEWSSVSAQLWTTQCIWGLWGPEGVYVFKSKIYMTDNTLGHKNHGYLCLFYIIESQHSHTLIQERCVQTDSFLSASDLRSFVAFAKFPSFSNFFAMTDTLKYGVCLSSQNIKYITKMNKIYILFPISSLRHRNAYSSAVASNSDSCLRVFMQVAVQGRLLHPTVTSPTVGYNILLSNISVIVT